MATPPRRADESLRVGSGSTWIEAKGIAVVMILMTLFMVGTVLWATMQTTTEIALLRESFATEVRLLRAETVKVVANHAATMHRHNESALASHDSLHRDVAHITSALRDTKTILEYMIYGQSRRMEVPTDD